jgi:hypothetical protein
MRPCKDPRLTYLNDQGYCVLRLPRKGIVPLGIIGRAGNTKNWLGTLDQIWKSEAPVPVVGAPQTVSNLAGGKTSDIDVTFGLDILANALNGMFGGSAPSLDTHYKDAKSVQFKLGDVTSVSIDPFIIGNYITKGELASQNPFVKKYFGGDKRADALVITEILQARAIGVVAKKDDNTAVGVNVPAIQSVLGAKVGVSASGSDSTEVTYQNPDPLTFGFKVFKISFADGAWTIEEVAPSEKVAFADNEDNGPRPVVMAGGLVEIGYSSIPA